jgi:hypothetical protein
MTKDKWAFSSDGKYFVGDGYNTIEEALVAGLKDCEYKEPVYVGKCVFPPISRFLDDPMNSVIADMRQSAAQQCGDLADEWLIGVGPEYEGYADINKVIREIVVRYVEKVDPVDFFFVDEARLWPCYPKIYKINDCDWYAGFTFKDTIALACKDTDLPEVELVEFPHALFESDMDRLQFVGDEQRDGKPVKCSFREALVKMINNGDKFPKMFASTEY